MYRIDMGIDLGTSKVCIYMRDKGIVINQPSVLAYERKEKKIIAVGYKAKKMLGKTTEAIVVEEELPVFEEVEVIPNDEVVDEIPAAGEAGRGRTARRSPRSSGWRSAR